MKTIYAIILTVLIGLSPQICTAGEREDRALIRSDIKALLHLHREGVRLHLRYYPWDIASVSECTRESEPLRTAGKRLKDDVMKIQSDRYLGARFPLQMAADAAFQCVYCGGDGSICNKVPDHIKELRRHLKQ